MHAGRRALPSRPLPPQSPPARHPPRGPPGPCPGSSAPPKIGFPATAPARTAAGRQPPAVRAVRCRVPAIRTPRPGGEAAMPRLPVRSAPSSAPPTHARERSPPITTASPPDQARSQPCGRPRLTRRLPACPAWPVGGAVVAPTGPHHTTPSAPRGSHESPCSSGAAASGWPVWKRTVRRVMLLRPLAAVQPSATSRPANPFLAHGGAWVWLEATAVHHPSRRRPSAPSLA
jgi:hypothetical protein